MSLYVLDTDVLTLLQNGDPVVVRNVASHAADPLAITVLTVEEQIIGRFAQLRRARQADQVALAYQRLADTVYGLSRLPILSFTRHAIARYDQLTALRLNIGKMDLRIAAITLENNGILVTRNLRDFQRVPNLVVENWAV